MKKLLLSVYISLFFIQFTNAQFVEIPDTAFRSYLIKSYPNCFNANKQLDTTCSQLNATEFLFIKNKGIRSIDGVRYFKNLMLLSCDSNQIEEIPVLPENLTWLICSNNPINKVTTLPKGLIDFDARNTNITCFPYLPLTLNNFGYDTDKIHCFPNRTTTLNTLPLCDVSNNNDNCGLYEQGIVGNIFYDYNNNGVKDTNEVYNREIVVCLKDQNNSVYYSHADKNGNYFIRTANPGIFSQSYIAAPAKFDIIADSGSVTIANTGQFVTQNIRLVPNEIFDSIIISDARGVIVSAFQNSTPYNLESVEYLGGQVSIEIQNAGTTVADPTIQVSFTSTLLWPDSVNRSDYVIKDSVISFVEHGLRPGEVRSAIVYIYSVPAASVGFEDYSFGAPCSAKIFVSVAEAKFKTPNKLVYLGCVGLLPLKLINFESFPKGDRIEFNWLTENEVNVKKIELQYSDNGYDFVTLLSMNAKGGETNNYSVSVKRSETKQYYRLLITDVDGKVSYSKIILIKPANSTEAIGIYPNPVRNTLTVLVKDNNINDIESVLVNSNGSIVRTIKLKSGTNTVDISSLPSGLYVLKNEFGIKRIVKL